MPAAGAAADFPSRPCSARPQAAPAEKTMNRAGLIIALAIAAVVGVVFGLYPQIDLMIAAPFHDISLRGNPFGLRIYPPLLLARDIGLWVGTAVIVPVVSALVVKLLRPRRRLLLSGRAILFLMTTSALGPGLLANAVLKEHWGRPRPIEVTQFGGTEHFVAWWDPRGECDKNCSFVSGDVAGHERTVLVALAARIPPGDEMLGAAELRHFNRPRPAPVLLEHGIGQEPRAERDGRHQKQNGAARQQKPPPRQKQFEHQRRYHRDDYRGSNPQPDVAGEQQRGINAQAERIAAQRYVVERRGDHQIELWIEPEHHADDGGDGKRNDQSGTVHGFSAGAACGLAEQGREGKSAAAPATGIAAGDQPIGKAEHHADRGRDLGLARDRWRRMID